jgi:hypothetical protein
MYVTSQQGFPAQVHGVCLKPEIIPGLKSDPPLQGRLHARHHISINTIQHS